MQVAASAPWLRSFVLGGIALALAGGYVLTADHSHRQRLVLHACSRPDAVYISVFRNGPVPLDGESGHRLVFQTWASVSDGCRWLATERLDPLDAHRYAYSYDEQILECDPGATPATKTPRRGIVTVEP